MNYEGLNDNQLSMLAEMRVVFNDADWMKLDELFVSPMSDFKKTFAMETLLLQARNRFVRETGTQPDNGLDARVANLFS